MKREATDVFEVSHKGERIYMSPDDRSPFRKVGDEIPISWLRAGVWLAVAAVALYLKIYIPA